MIREEYENPMIRPREREEYSKYCTCCEYGIPFLAKYYELPTGRNGIVQIWCERCFDGHMSYAKHDTTCICCGEDISEDDDCFVTDDAECICLDCLEDMSAVNSD